ncbi:MAG: putative PEP-binding protein [Oscillospiraceae bacterium]
MRSLPVSVDFFSIGTNDLTSIHTCSRSNEPHAANNI